MVAPTLATLAIKRLATSIKWTFNLHWRAAFSGNSVANAQLLIPVQVVDYLGLVPVAGSVMLVSSLRGMGFRRLWANVEHCIMATDLPMTTDFLSKLFEAHGIPSVIENDWIAPNHQLPAMRALWHPQESKGQLDIQTLVGDQRCIEECFVGMGQGQAALKDAMLNFTINSFHVLLASLWNHNDPEQVMTEPWLAGGKRYTAFIGNFGRRSSGAARSQLLTNPITITFCT